MINIWNVKGYYTFLHILFGKSLSYLTPLSFLHNHNQVSPGELFFRYWFFIVESCRFCFKSFFEYLFSGLASILILVAYKKYFHDVIKALFVIITFALLSCNVFAIAVTPSQIDFTDYDKASLVVFNTEDYVKDFSLSLGQGFTVDDSLLKIPPRSSKPVKIFCSCEDCATSLYVRELSDSPGIRIEPAVVVRLSSGSPPEDEEFFFDEPNEVTSFSFLDVKKPEVLAFVIVSSLLLASVLVFFGRKVYIKKFFRKSKSRKRK